MSETGPSHAGIELDVLELPAMGPSTKTPNTSPGKRKPGPAPKNPKAFVRSIYKKIQKEKSFLSFSGHVSDVNRILKMKYSSAKDIADVIMKDTALTAKLLNLVNSSFYGQFSKRGVATISEAMIILGAEEIKLAAASLKLYEMMQESASRQILKEKTLKGLQRSLIAVRIAREAGYRKAEELQVSAMMYGFGEFLVALFEPDVYMDVELFMKDNRVSSEEASKSVIGVSFHELGRIIAAQWNFPDSIVEATRPVTGLKINKDSVTFDVLQRFICAFSDEIVSIDAHAPDTDVGKELVRISQAYRHILDIGPVRAKDLLESSWEKIVSHASILQVDTRRKPVVSKELDLKRLNQGIDDIGRLMENEFTIHEVLTRIVDQIWEKLGFSRVCVCIKNKAAGTMEARFVRGADAPAFEKNFKFKIIRTSDLFNQCLHNNRSAIVDNLETSHLKSRVPSWYMEGAFARAFAVFPVVIDSKIVAMLYSDWDPEKYDITDDVSTCLDRFRDLIITAMKKKR